MEDAVRSPELRRGGRRMVVTATKRAGWWIPLGIAGSLLWVGAKVLVPLAARAAIDDGFSPYDSTAILEVVRRDPRARRVRGARRRVPLVLRVLRRAPHRARAALAAVRAPAAAALRVSRPRADREPDGAGKPRPAPDQPARRVRSRVRGERRDGRRDPRGAVRAQRQAHAARAHQLPAARDRRGVVPEAPRSGRRPPAGAARRGVGGRRRGRGGHPRGQGLRRRAGGEGAARRAGRAGSPRSGRARQAARHVQPDARPAADGRARDGAVRRAARTRSTDRSPSATSSRSARCCSSSCSRCA